MLKFSPRSALVLKSGKFIFWLSASFDLKPDVWVLFSKNFGSGRSKLPSEKVLKVFVGGKDCPPAPISSKGFKWGGGVGSFWLVYAIVKY